MVFESGKANKVSAVIFETGHAVGHNLLRFGCNRMNNSANPLERLLLLAIKAPEIVIHNRHICNCSSRFVLRPHSVTSYAILDAV